jgi:DNA-binding XRE family transcriptional regulator
MTPDEFKAWRKAMDYSQADAAKALDLSKGTIENYERGHRIDNKQPVVIPHVVALACAALFHRLTPWSAPLTFEFDTHCPICLSAVLKPREYDDGRDYDCPHCGPFRITLSAYEMAKHKSPIEKQEALDNAKTAANGGKVVIRSESYSTLN